ncbi:MAG: hypothetical protein Kow0080_00530 [Candidatus Promineifilaceae bacterium]
MTFTLQIGLPRMHKEPGERRDFLPDFVGKLARRGAEIYLEHSYGSGMGIGEEAYHQAGGTAVHFVSREETYRQPYVLVLRYPTDDEIRLMQPGACLISMVHYPTRPQRITFLRERGLEAISLDSITDDVGRRLVENLRAVAWNGLEVAFQTLQKTYPAPGLTSPERPPIQVTVVGVGGVGTEAVAAAIRYGDPTLRQKMLAVGAPGVQVTAVDYDLTGETAVMRAILSQTDILVDATQRPDAAKPVIPNEWVGWLPQHAVLLDLSVDPYICDKNGIVQTKGIEGVPQGNLDQYVFAPNDPAYDQLPNCVNRTHRRHAVSCYSWPGIHPHACMEVYGKQLQPILRTLIKKGGVQGIDPNGRYFERAIARATLSRLT